MIPIELPIFFDTKETSYLSKSGMDFLYKDCEVKNVWFFQINYILPITDDDGLKYSKIGSNGDVFIVNMEYKKLIQHIKIYNTNLN